MRKFVVLGVPSSAGARRTGQELAAQSFRRAGLIEKLHSVDLDVTDFGDLPEISFRPDPQHANSQNLPLVIEVNRGVTRQVERAVGDNCIPVVLGGDCTITLGVLAGVISCTPNVGLLYFDGDLDLNTPETTPSGIFDGMVMAHITGSGAESLARSGPRYPLMAEQDIVLFGYNADSDSIDTVEVDRLGRSKMEKYPASRIKGQARKSAMEALALLESRADAVVVHFDVDAIDFDDFPAADVPHYRGLSFNDAMSALEVFLASPRLAAFVVTEFNVNRDPQGVLSRRLVEALVGAMKKTGE